MIVVDRIDIPFLSHRQPHRNFGSLLICKIGLNVPFILLVQLNDKYSGPTMYDSLPSLSAKKFP